MRNSTPVGAVYPIEKDVKKTNLLVFLTASRDGNHHPPAMKRLVTLLLLSASIGFAQDETLAMNTVMRTAKALVVLKAGTTVHVISHGEKTVTVKVGNTIGLIPWSALEESQADADLMMSAPTKPKPRQVAPTKVAAVPTPAVAATANSSEPSTPPAPRRAQSMYGKMVEKARENAGSHEKNLVSPADEVLTSK